MPAEEEDQDEEARSPLDDEPEDDDIDPQKQPREKESRGDTGKNKLSEATHKTFLYVISMSYVICY